MSTLSSGTVTFGTTMIDRTSKILFGLPEPTNYADGRRSLGELCLHRLSTSDHNSVVLIDAATSDELTASALRAAAIRVATWLRSIGIKSGENVVICSENRMEFAHVIFGTFLVGATLVPINYTSTGSDLQNMIELVKPKIVFASSSTFFNVSKVAFKSIERVVVFDGGNTTIDKKNIISYNTIINDLRSTSDDASCFDCDPQNIDTNIALILFAPVTNERSVKGVQLSERNVMFALTQYSCGINSDLNSTISNPITLSPNLWSNSIGCLTLILMVMKEAQMVFIAKFNEAQFLEAIKKYQVNTVNAAPPVMMFLAKNPSVANYDLSSLKVIYCGTDAISDHFVAAVQNCLAVPFVRQTYGMAEATLGLTMQTDVYRRRGSAGGLKPGNFGRVVDKHGHNLGPNEVGELLFAGPTIMKGYIETESMCARNVVTVDVDGWLHTGDIGSYDEHGEYFILNDAKEEIGFQSERPRLNSEQRLDKGEYCMEKCLNISNYTMYNMAGR